MKRIAMLAAPLLAIGLLAGCGDDAAEAQDSPKDATVEEFCAPWVDLITNFSDKEDISDEDAVKLARDTADKLREAGTPKDIPADARKGFELIIKKIDDLPEDASKQEVEDFQKLTDEEQKYSDALFAYLAQTCAAQLIPDAS